jgi:hypothetical protein
MLRANSGTLPTGIFSNEFSDLGQPKHNGTDWVKEERDAGARVGSVPDAGARRVLARP